MKYQFSKITSSTPKFKIKQFTSDETGKTSLHKNQVSAYAINISFGKNCPKAFIPFKNAQLEKMLIDKDHYLFES